MGRCASDLSIRASQLRGQDEFHAAHLEFALENCYHRGAIAARPLACRPDSASRRSLLMSTSPGLGELGNLAQSARVKELKTARGILFFVGILTIAVNIGFIAFAEKAVDSQIETELKPLRQQGMEIDPTQLAEFREQAIRSTRLVNGIAVLIGLVFVVCGVYVYQYPVPATVISLVLYLGSAAVYGVLDPTTLARGWIIKIIVVVCLFKAVQAAIASENERKAAANAALQSNPPATPI
jgi:hypothetical protein